MAAPAHIVLVDGVSKTFRIPREQVHTLKERVLHPLRRPGHDVLRALREVSFSVAPGEFFGIVGRNGSGKSTLLKAMAGIYRVDSGKIYVNERLSTFIELGVGFNNDLAAFDNVVLNATMLGLDPDVARERYEDIIRFAELEEFEDLKIKNYSSGMLVRLAFAVMIHVDAGVLLIDEVLAVGDASFQQKCFEEFERIHEAGKTVLLVTHDMAAVNRFCTRAMLLEKGRVVAIGDPEAVGSKYLELNFSEEARAAEAEAAGVAGEGVRPPRVLPRADTATRFGDGSAEVLDAWFENDAGERTDTLRSQHHCTFACDVAFREAARNPRFTVTLQNSHRDNVFSASTEFKDVETGDYEAGDGGQFRVFFGNVLSPDRYTITVTVERPGGAWMDRRERMFDIVVTGTTNTGALVQLPYETAVHRVPGGAVTARQQQPG